MEQFTCPHEACLRPVFLDGDLVGRILGTPTIAAGAYQMVCPHCEKITHLYSDRSHTRILVSKYPCDDREGIVTFVFHEPAKNTRLKYKGVDVKPFEKFDEALEYVQRSRLGDMGFLLDLNPELPDDQGWEELTAVNAAQWFTKHKAGDVLMLIANKRLYPTPKIISEYYIVWNEEKTEGFVTIDKQLAYETRKCADTNLFDENGVYSPLAKAFCDKWGDGDCTTETVSRTK